MKFNFDETYQLVSHHQFYCAIKLSVNLKTLWWWLCHLLSVGCIISLFEKYQQVYSFQ